MIPQSNTITTITNITMMTIMKAMNSIKKKKTMNFSKKTSNNLQYKAR